MPFTPTWPTAASNLLSLHAPQADRGPEEPSSRSGSLVVGRVTREDGFDQQVTQPRCYRNTPDQALSPRSPGRVARGNCTPGLPQIRT